MPPSAWLGLAEEFDEVAFLARLSPRTVMIMGDNPALPPIPQRPTFANFLTNFLANFLANARDMARHRRLQRPSPLSLFC